MPPSKNGPNPFARLCRAVVSSSPEQTNQQLIFIRLLYDCTAKVRLIHNGASALHRPSTAAALHFIHLPRRPPPHNIDVIVNNNGHANDYDDDDHDGRRDNVSLKFDYLNRSKSLLVSRRAAEPVVRCLSVNTAGRPPV